MSKSTEDSLLGMSFVVYPDDRGDGTVELERGCEPCEGRPGKTSCSACHGTGIVPSEAGRFLLEFLAKYG